VFFEDFPATPTPFSMGGSRFTFTIVQGQGNRNAMPLQLLIDDTEASAALVTALTSDAPDDETEEYGKALYQLAMDVIQAIFDYLRNMVGMEWQSAPLPDEEEWDGFLQLSCVAEYSVDGSTWQRLHVSRKRVFGGFTARWGLKQAHWDELPAFISSRRKAPMANVLIRNSSVHLSQGNGRLAVVEGVTALEVAVKNLFPQVLHVALQAPELEYEAVDRIVQGTGLTGTTRFLIGMVRDRLQLTEDELSALIEGVDARNNVVHNAQRQVDLQQARAYVDAIEKFVRSCRIILAEEIKP